jgi:hypothetical protein
MQVFPGLYIAWHAFSIHSFINPVDKDKDLIVQSIISQQEIEETYMYYRHI